MNWKKIARLALVVLCIGTVFSVRAQESTENKPVETDDKACCVCYATFDPRNVQATATSQCSTVDWGRQCAPDRQYTCFLYYDEAEKQIKYQCIQKNITNAEYFFQSPSDCSSLHVVADVAADDPATTAVDESAGSLRDCRRGIWHTQTANELWPECVNLLGQCKMSNPQHRQQLCTDILRQAKVRKENPTLTFPEIIYKVTEEGLTVNKQCLEELNNNPLPDLLTVYKITLEPKGEVVVQKCVSGTPGDGGTPGSCTDVNLEEFCPESARPRTPGGHGTPSRGDGADLSRDPLLKVTVYTQPPEDCPPCKELKEKLDSEKPLIPYTPITIPKGNPKKVKIPNECKTRDGYEYPCVTVQYGGLKRSASSVSIENIRNNIKELKALYYSKSK